MPENMPKKKYFAFDSIVQAIETSPIKPKFWYQALKRKRPLAMDGNIGKKHGSKTPFQISQVVFKTLVQVDSSILPMTDL